ncbi:MAG: protein-glutamate O-methyltransferase CheR [Gemmatimonadetes bacterium]|nr:protein-glutamate O-methyltransferase CheR [Gemmatimonadota bacterium]
MSVSPSARGVAGAAADQRDLEEIEIDLLADGVFRQYGYDFRNYARSSLRRRVREAARAEKVATVSELQAKVLHDPACMERLLLTLSINATSMFRDPHFFLAFREKVVPILRTYPFIRIWHAGCSSGEEVYSMAILLEEEGLYERCRIYATDMNEVVVRKAETGIFSLSSMRDNTANYLAAGGRSSFSEYYTAACDSVVFRPALKRNVLFCQHNLTTDASFNEFNVIFCRNVMIYFDTALQERVHRLVYESLSAFGILGLGDKESLRFTPYESRYEPVAGREKLYRRAR